MPGLICAIHQPNFFPRLSTLAKLYAADVWVILDNVQFARRDYQHRCYLPAAAANLPPRWLTVPVRLPGGRDTLIRDVRVADPALAARHVEELIPQYFRAAPYHAELRDVLAPAAGMIRSGGTLAGASTQTVTVMLRALGWRGTIVRSSDFAVSSGRSGRLADLAAQVGAATYLCGTGGRRYLDLAPFAQRGVHVGFFSPPARLADVVPDGHRVTALADLASAGVQALACHLTRHAGQFPAAAPSGGKAPAAPAATA